MVGLATLTLTECIGLKTATEGFSSSTIAMLVGLYFVIAGLEATGFMKKVAVKMLGKPRGYNHAIVRVMLAVGALSGFLSNTAVVALFVKVVKHWANQLNIAPSKLLLPLSYASNIGGTLLLIGSPTNLIIADKYTERTGDEVGLFFPLVTGLVCLAVGIISVLAMQKLLPVRRPPEEELVGNSTVTELIVPSDSPFVGQTIDESPQLDANPLTFCLVLMVSCSCSFATPTGSMPNLLVYVPGGYRFTDFIRIGVPMNIIILLVNVVVASLLFPLH